MIDVIRRQCVAINFLNFEEPGDIFENLQTAIKNDVYLNKHYKAVNLFLSSDKYTMVPEKIFDKKNAREYMQTIHPLENNEEVHFAKCENEDFYLLYGYPSEMTTFLVNHFPEIRLYHNVKLLLANGFRHAKTQTFLAEIMIHQDFFDILLIKNSKVQLLNSFSFGNDNDIVYYVLNVLQKNEFRPEETTLFVNGNINSNAKAIVELRKRIKNLNFNINNEYNFSFKNTPEHLWSSLLLDK